MPGEVARRADAEVQASLLSAAGWGVLSEGPAAGHCSCYFPSKVGSSDETFNADFSCTT